MAALPRVKKEYQIPRGRLIFFPFDSAGNRMGGRQFGNCPGFKLSVEGNKAPHYSSEGGMREKDEDVLIEVVRKASVITDNISSQNLGIFLSGAVEQVQQQQGTVADEEHAVEPGGIYQLGVSIQLPTGVRNVTDVEVKGADGTTTYEEGKDFIVDVDLGLLQILVTGSVPKGKVKVGYSKASATWERVKSGDGTGLKGALQLIADNAHGANRDWFFPKVSLSPSGELPLIEEGTDYSQFGIDVEVLKPDNGEAVYVDGRAAAIP